MAPPSIRPPKPIQYYILPAIFIGFLFYLQFSRETPQVSDQPQLLHFTGKAMGTGWSVKVYAQPNESSIPPEQVDVRIRNEIEDVNQKMSTYLTDSELILFNKSSNTDPVTVSHKTFAVVKEAQRISEHTDGAFDITLRPLISAWGFGSGQEESPPKPEDIALLMANTGHTNIQLNEVDHTITKTIPDLELDVSAIAKGYAVDQVADMLHEIGFRNYMVEVGGETRAYGKNPKNEVWKIGIERPDAARGVLIEIIALNNTSIATSGDYRNYHEKFGKRISHTIDGRTGYPIEHKLASVSVIHPSNMTADAWATAINVLGPEEGFEMAKQQNLAVMMLIRNDNGEFERKTTDAFLAYQVKMD